MNNRDNLVSVLASIYQWRKAIRNIMIVTLVGSIGATLLMDNYYKATTIFYAASPELANPELIFGYTSQVTQYFGSDRDLDRIAEIANSAAVIDYMVKKFHLYEHYDIDSTTLKGKYKVREHFIGLYTAQKNKNDAIELSVEDTDPKLAAEMANAARDKINEIGQSLIKNSQATLLTTFDNNMNRKKRELIQLGDSLRDMQAFYGIYNAGTQGEHIASQLSNAESEIVHGKARLEVLENNPLIPQDTIQYMKADLRAFEMERKQLLSKDISSDNLTLKQYNEGLPKISVLADLHYQARKQLSFDQERYNQIKAAYNTNIPAVQLLETAEVPLVKSRPKRTILIIAALVAALFFSIIGVLIFDSYRDFNWDEITKKK
jgi:capsular polysaccharide biosynthesis protein